MVISSSPPEGGRRARLAAERRGRETPSQGTEVLQSRRSRRAQGLLNPDELNPDEQLAGNEFTQTGSMLLTPYAPSQPSQQQAPQPPQAPHPAPEGLFSAPPFPGPPTSSLPTSSLPTRRSAARTSPAGPSTTELEIIRGRRAARPQSARRRAELALGRSISNRRVWGGVLAVAMVLVVPGASMLQSSVTVADGGLSGAAELAALQQNAPPTTADQPDIAQTTAAARAQAKVKAAAGALAATAEQARAAAEKANKKSRTPSAGSTGRLNTQLSGLPWVSGVFSAGDGVSGVKEFGNWRGAPVDVVIDWGARQSWNDIINPSWLYSSWKGTPYTKVFGIAPVPEGDDSATMAGCAAGSYNDKWRQFGQNIKSAGLDDETVIRLGWEFNGDWYKWKASDPNQFAECWRQIVTSAESTAPALLWDWTVIRGNGKSVVDARKAYPGDAYVDIVGVDAYDMWPGATDESSWAEQYSGPYGLKFWSDFARAHGKKVSVPEWGVYPTNSASTGGDNPFFISKMQGFFKAEGSHLAYESYFNESAAYISASLFGPTQNPAAAAKYKSLFGS